VRELHNYIAFTTASMLQHQGVLRGRVFVLILADKGAAYKYVGIPKTINFFVSIPKSAYRTISILVAHFIYIKSKYLSCMA
jgi:hypothetical protein